MHSPFAHADPHEKGATMHRAQRPRPKRCVQVTATQPYVVPGLAWWVDPYRGGPRR